MINLSSNLSLLAKKTANVLLLHAYPNLQKTVIHEISLDRLQRLLDVDARDHRALKDALITLMSTTIEWKTVDDAVPGKNLGSNVSTLLSFVGVENGIVKYQYSELIKRLIINHKKYGFNLIV